MAQSNPLVPAGRTLTIQVPARVSGLRGAALLLIAGLAPVPTVAEEPSKKFQLFGYLTQAYGQSSRGSILGSDEDGTTDLGNVAVQFRWNKSRREAVVVQLAHERRGDDLFLPKDENVDIDWAFYERRFGDNTRLKVGRLNIPLGIYNEVRDVGTLLPFFNLPLSAYPGVLSSAETVDGVSLSHTFLPRSTWTFDGELYFGGWDTFQQRLEPASEFGVINLEARAEHGVGVQLWANTPLPGMRLGAGALTWEMDGPISLPDKDRWWSYHASLDLTRDRWVLRAEARRWEFDQDFGAFAGMPMSIPGEAERDGYYVQAGLWVTEKTGLFAMYEATALNDDLGLFPALDSFHKEWAASANYRFNPDLQVRIEVHTADTRLPIGLPGSGSPGLPPTAVDWGIVAFSVSF